MRLKGQPIPARRGVMRVMVRPKCLATPASNGCLCFKCLDSCVGEHVSMLKAMSQRDLVQSCASRSAF